MNRAQKQAHLTLHGWRPISLAGGHGIVHDDWGGPVFTLGPWAADPLGQRANTVYPLQANSVKMWAAPAEWGDNGLPMFAILCRSLAEHWPSP
jgi:hypothetical protein